MTTQSSQNNPTLSLQGNYAQEVLSYYLWGQKNAPDNKDIVDEQYIDRPTNITMENVLVENKETKELEPEQVAIKLQINAQEYLDTIGFQAAKVGAFQKFFNNVKDQTFNWQTFGIEDIKKAGGIISENGKTISLTHQQFVDMTYNPNDSKNVSDKDKGKNLERYNDALKGKMDISQYNVNTHSDDYWQRAFVFGSTKFQIDTENLRYVFDAETGKALELQNLKVQPLDDDFDFISTDGTAGKINPILEQIMDPSGIGKTVGFEFTFDDDSNKFLEVNSGTFTFSDYMNYLYKFGMNSNEISDNYNNVIGYGYGETPIYLPKTESPNHIAYINGLKELNKSGVYDFRDEFDRVVVLVVKNQMIYQNIPQIMNTIQSKNQVRKFN